MSDTPAAPATLLRAAVVQMDVRIGEIDTNLRRVRERLTEAVENGAKLIVFPECALQGYCYDSLEGALRFATEPFRSPSADFGAACEALHVTGVVGLLEREQDRCFNSALIAVEGTWSHYYKTHLPTLGVDRFATPGNELKVYNAPFGKLGVLICYDIRFSEAARCLSLMGADVIALPTNWPEGAESAPDFLTRARAWENRVYILAANRVGIERGRRFIGRSQIVAPTGEILCEAGADEETILYADLDLSLARQKRIVIEPGEWELDITGDRRPELYGELIKAN